MQRPATAASSSRITYSLRLLPTERDLLARGVYASPCAVRNRFSGFSEGLHQSWHSTPDPGFSVDVSVVSSFTHSIQNQAEQDTTLPEALLAKEGVLQGCGLSALTKAIPSWTLELSHLHPLLEIICALCFLGNSDRPSCPQGRFSCCLRDRI